MYSNNAVHSAAFVAANLEAGAVERPFISPEGANAPNVPTTPNTNEEHCPKDVAA